MKRGKKGVTQVDWVVSFAIFFLYLAWFFIFIRTSSEQPSQTGSELSAIRENLINDASWTVDALPVFVDSNLTLEDEPVIIGFPFSWEARNMGFRDGREYYIAERKVFFLANLTNVSRNIFWMAHSAENYTTVNKSGMIAGATGVDSGQFGATFRNSVPESITHSGNLRMSGFNISLDGDPILDFDPEFNRTFMIARYSAKADLINMSFYVFASRPRIYGYAYSNSLYPKNLTITATLHNYTEYYAHENSRGMLNETCTAFAGEYVDLYEKTGISFFMQDPANGSICSSDGKTVLSLTLPLRNETSFSIFMHGGDYRNTTKYKGRGQQLGMVEKLSGISLRLIGNINRTDYEGLKRNWSYPPEKDFAFFLINESDETVAALQPFTAPAATNVYGDSSKVNVLDRNGNKKRHTLLINGW